MPRIVEGTPFSEHTSWTCDRDTFRKFRSSELVMDSPDKASEEEPTTPFLLRLFYRTGAFHRFVTPYTRLFQQLD